ncbi:MAG: D-2-hydroxyacid dehydrogenase [Anaerovoracaceae bacterium]|jgi:glycerate dehydrogenase
MKIVFLDAETTNPGDLSWDRLAALGEIEIYPRSTREQAKERVKDADVVIFNGFDMDREIIECAPRLKFLCIAATGYDNLDLQAARERGIGCANVPAYSTEAVAQHTIALMLEMTNHVGMHDDSVRRHEWDQSRGECYWLAPMTLLDGKSLGICGYGRIGRRVARIAEAMGMKINIYSRDRAAALGSDFVTLHLPAAENTIGFISEDTIAQMKDGAFLINAARGALIDDNAVAGALRSGKLAGYAADVLSVEPPAEDNVLIGLPGCIITPHHAWCPIETRQKLLDVCIDNIDSWMKGTELNRIDK